MKKRIFVAIITAMLLLSFSSCADNESSEIVTSFSTCEEAAAACGVDFAAAGWSHGLLPEVAEFMREKSDYYFSTVKEFEEFLYG